MVLFLAYIATIPIANWLISHWGTICVPGGACLIPVLPGVYAPSGVLMIGAALVLRDLVQRRYGPAAGLFCIFLGSLVSFAVAPPALVAASVGAFAFSELADFAVYTPLATRRFILAVTLSVCAGAVVDSALFLWLAFGSLDHIAGQIVGKVYAAVAFILAKTAMRATRFQPGCTHVEVQVSRGGSGGKTNPSLRDTDSSI